MLGRIVEVADDKRYLFVSRGFLVVQETEGERNELGQVPLDDVAAVIGNAHGLSYSNNLLVALAERGTPFVLCASNHNAVGMLWPVEGNFQQAKRFDAQLAASKPTHKRLWAQIVKFKLHQQATVLRAADLPMAPLSSLAARVRSGDPENLEALGARRYWPMLFGQEFRRQREEGGINSLLNYGYTVFRAATARAVIGAGLHPTLGIHHTNEGNAMRLVDDLMEPFRPLVDLVVWQLRSSGTAKVTPDAKRQLVGALFDELPTSEGVTPVAVCMQRMATSLALVYTGERNELELPKSTIPGSRQAAALMTGAQC